MLLFTVISYWWRDLENESVVIFPYQSKACRYHCSCKPQWNIFCMDFIQTFELSCLWSEGLILKTTSSKYRLMWSTFALDVQVSVVLCSLTLIMMAMLWFLCFLLNLIWTLHAIKITFGILHRTFKICYVGRYTKALCLCLITRPF